MDFNLYFKSRQGEIANLLKKLVHLESPTSDKKAVDACTAFVVQEFRKLGAKVIRLPQKDIGDLCVIETSAKDRSASRDQILVLTHADTVWPVGKIERMPFYISGKEVSLEDMRLSLGKMPDRFFEHPATVLVVTNMYYGEAPWLMPKSVSAATSMVWKDVPLQGTTAFEFGEQIKEMDGFLAKHWQAHHSPLTGNPVYERPVVLVFYREDYKFLLHNIIPHRGISRADYDLVIASQPYRSRVSAEFKAGKVIAPLARALGKGGRLLGIHSYGKDPGLEVIQKVWPGENPFPNDRHDILRAVKAELGKEARHYNFNANSDARAIFRYDMHALPTEISSSIGTSTLFAAWNAAVYVAQIEDQRLAGTLKKQNYLEATNHVLQKHGGLWFHDESYIISRKRDG